MQVFLPFDDKYVSGRVVEAPSLSSGGQLPTIELVERKQVSSKVQELVLQPKLPGPGYIGSINVTGVIVDWSLPKTETPAQNEVHISSFCMLLSVWQVVQLAVIAMTLAPDDPPSPTHSARLGMKLF